MSRVTVVVDGETKIDGDLTQWQHKPPSFLSELADKNTKPCIYIQAAGVALANALIRSTPISIDIQTTPNGWSMSVVYDT